MKIRKFSPPSSSTLTNLPSSISSPSSSFSSTSHSSILTHHSPENNSNSSSSSPYSSSSTTRCEGLDLLVMAVHYLAGSIVGIPFAQKRVIRRRRPAIRFSNLIVNGVFESQKDEKLGKEEREKDGFFNPKKPKRQRRVMALPSKYQDSVLQPWKRSSRRRQQSAAIVGRSGQ